MWCTSGCVNGFAIALWAVVSFASVEKKSWRYGPGGRLKVTGKARQGKVMRTDLVWCIRRPCQPAAPFQCRPWYQEWCRATWAFRPSSVRCWPSGRWSRETESHRWCARWGPCRRRTAAHGTRVGSPRRFQRGSATDACRWLLKQVHHHHRHHCYSGFPIGWLRHQFSTGTTSHLDKMSCSAA